MSIPANIDEYMNYLALDEDELISDNVPVDYVPVRYVKKPNGSKPGMVIFTHNRTVYVTPKLPSRP